MISDKLKKVLKIAWFLPGFLLWAAYPPMGEVADVLFALAPLMWLSRRAVDARESARRWFQSGLFYWVATLSWMPAIVKNGGPWPLVVLGWFALAAYCSLFFWLYGWLSAKYWCWARNLPQLATLSLRSSHFPHFPHYLLRLIGILIVEPVLWCGLELIRSRFLGGFAWNQLGVVPVNAGFGAPAAIGGVYLCSAVVILINGTITGIAERMWKPERSGFANLKRLGSLETLLVFVLVLGVYKTSPVLSPDPQSQASDAPFLKVALIQRNFPCVFKAQEEDSRQIYARLLENVSALRPELVVLPESAMCEFGPVDQQGALRFAEWVWQKTGASLLAGGTRYDDGNTYNSAALYAFQTSRTSRAFQSISCYDKVHLVPFGEFIPGDKWFPSLQKLAPVGSCTAGEPKLLRHSCGETPFGVAICFEDTDSALVRRLAGMGARFLCFLTNDSWFSHSVESEQHAWQAVARAVETGLPVVRVGNSGVSGTIAPDGRATWLAGANGKPLVDRRGTMFDRLVLSKSVPSPRQTPYVRLGDWPLGSVFALLILCMIVVKYKSNYEKRRFLSV